MVDPTPIVHCDAPDCETPAEYKIAAPWSDREGRFWELKTYGFACRKHLRDVLRSAEARWLDYEPVPGEVVDYIGVYRHIPGIKDRNLERVDDLDGDAADVD